jgi:hypothetical protein
MYSVKQIDRPILYKRVPNSRTPSNSGEFLPTNFNLGHLLHDSYADALFVVKISQALICLICLDLSWTRQTNDEDHEKSSSQVNSTEAIFIPISVLL